MTESKIVFEEVESMVPDEGPSYDGHFSLGFIGTSPDRGKRGWCVFLEGAPWVEGRSQTEPEARLAAAKAARDKLLSSVPVLDAIIDELHQEVLRSAAAKPEES